MTAAARSDNNWLRHSVGPLSFVCWLCCLLLAALCDVSTTNSSICECSCSSCKCLRVGVVVGAAAAQSIDKTFAGALLFTYSARSHVRCSLARSLSRSMGTLLPPHSLSLTRSQQNSCSAYTKCKQTVKKLLALLCCSRILIENNCNQHQQKQSQGRRRTETSFQGARRGRLNDPASECRRRL